MKIHLVRYSFIVAATLATTLSFGQQIQPGIRIGDIRIVGLDRISEQLVRSQIEARQGQALSPRAVARDLRRLYDLGFFSTVRVDLDTSDDQAVLTYIFRENKFIEEIAIVGSDKIKPKDIRGVLLWKEGDSFESEAYARERDSILDLYASKGFHNTTVDIVVQELPASSVSIAYMIHEGKKARIRGITFEGNEALSSSRLRKIMKTRRGYWKLRGKFNDEKFENDLKTIVDEYANVGRLEAAIRSTDLSYSPNGKRMYIHIGFDEGPEYQIETMRIAGNFTFDDEELGTFLNVHPKNIHDESQIRNDAADMEADYRENGYINARVDPQVTLDRDKKTTHVVYRVNEGELKYVREIRITGNSITKDDVVRRQLLLDPGDRFDGSALRTSQNRLRSTAFFEGIRITAEDVEENDRFSDLLIDVEEGKTGNFSFGGGFSTDENFSSFAEIRLNNFDITNWPTFTGGGQQFSTRFILGDVRSQYSVSFTDPEIAGYPLAFGVDFFDESFRTRGGSSFRQDSQGASLRLAKSISPFVSVRTTLSFLDVELSDIASFLAPELNALRNPGSTISATFGVTRNTTDIIYDPNEGARHDLSLMIAGFGGENEFFKLEQDSTWYFPVGRDDQWVLSLRMREGWSEPFGDTLFVPIQDRFFVGGSSTVRGFDTRDIGPKALLTDGRREAIGGELRLIGNTELKYRLSELVSLITFFDAGAAWENVDRFESSDFKYSVGFGIGFNIPALGPLRIDFGFPLNPDADQGSSRIHLNSSYRF